MPKSGKIRGLTLLELIIVTFILAVLAAILIPNFVRARYKAHLTACITNERSLAGALETYRTEYKRYPSGGPLNPSHVIFTERFFTPPNVTCPSAYTIYELQSTPDNFTLYCNGSTHSFLLDVAPFYPQYSPSFGLRLNP